MLIDLIRNCDELVTEVLQILLANIVGFSMGYNTEKNCSQLVVPLCYVPVIMRELPDYMISTERVKNMMLSLFMNLGSSNMTLHSRISFIVKH